VYIIGRADGTFGLPQEAYTIEIPGAASGYYPHCLAVGRFQTTIRWPDLVVRLYDKSLVSDEPGRNGTFVAGNSYSHADTRRSTQGLNVMGSRSGHTTQQLGELPVVYRCIRGRCVGQRVSRLNYPTTLGLWATAA